VITLEAEKGVEREGQKHTQKEKVLVFYNTATVIHHKLLCIL
jgi:hypothetical protein